MLRLGDGIGRRRAGQLITLMFFVLASALVYAYAASVPTTFFLSPPEEETMAKWRLLSEIHLKDYDSPSANRGFDPGNRFGHNGNRRREIP